MSERSRYPGRGQERTLILTVNGVRWSISRRAVWSSRRRYVRHNLRPNRALALEDTTGRPEMKWLLTAVVLIAGGFWLDATYNHGTITRVVNGLARDIRHNFGV
jgi:hypothetical protein